MFPYLISHIMDSIFRSVSCLFLILTLTLSFAHAGEYHNAKERTSAQTTETLACSQCHTMHGTQGGQSLIYGGANAIYPKLLRQANILQLCLYCHDGNQAGMSSPVPPDIWGPTQNVTNGPSGGNLCSSGSEPANPPCSDTTISHTVDVNANVTPPGWAGATPLFTSATGGFTCINCHNQHGNTNYRNLRNNSYAGVDFTGVDVSYAYNTSVDPNDNTKYVNNWLSGTNLTKYQTSNVRFRKSPTASATGGIQAFCKACHNKFHFAGGESAAEMGGTAAGDTGTPWLRHPTMDVTIGEGQANLHVADSSFWTTTLTWFPRIINPDGIAGNADDQPFCFSCHRVHGSGGTNRHSNLIFGDPTTAVGGAGTMIRDTCLQCHNQ